MPSMPYIYKSPFEKKKTIPVDEEAARIAEDPETMLFFNGIDLDTPPEEMRLKRRGNPEMAIALSLAQLDSALRKAGEKHDAD